MRDHVHINAVFDAFGEDVDYSVLHKKSMDRICQMPRATAPRSVSHARRSKSSAIPMAIMSQMVAERTNLSLRMSMRPFTIGQRIPSRN
jgi:hypothetical protein